MVKKDVILFVSIFMVLLLITGGTYAYWSWNSNTTKTVVFNTSKGIAEYVIYNSGDSHFVGDFQPSSSFLDGMSNTLSFKLVDDNAYTEVGNMLVATIKMDVNFVGDKIRASEDVHWVLVDGSNTTVSTGTFYNVSSGSVITLKDNITVTTSLKTYTVWIWVDENGTNVNELSGDTVDVNIWTQIDMMDKSGSDGGAS